MSGDKLIKERSLSGNRLRNHAITGTQVNLRALGQVPSAANADHATTAVNAGSADHATSASSASSAVVAGNASTLGGQSPSAFDTSGNWVRTGLVTAAGGQTVPMATFGPFTLSLRCTGNGGGSFTADLLATSSEPNSDINDFQATQGVPAGAGLQAGPSSHFADSDSQISDFITASGQTWHGITMQAVHFPGVSNPCVATALIGRS